MHVDFGSWEGREAKVGLDDMADRLFVLSFCAPAMCFFIGETAGFAWRAKLGTGGRGGKNDARQEVSKLGALTS